jgi:hypothetical protein
MAAKCFEGMTRLAKLAAKGPGMSSLMECLNTPVSSPPMSFQASLTERARADSENRRALVTPPSVSLTLPLTTNDLSLRTFNGCASCLLSTEASGTH